MVFQVLDVVAHEVLERGRLRGADGLPGQVIEIVARARTRELRGVRGRHHAGDVLVVGPPEHEQIRPRPILIPLHADPRVLVVAGEDEVALQLRAHEAAVIVAGRIDQVADNLLARPLAGCGTAGGRGTISFVEQESDASNADAKLWIRELDPKARRVTPLVAAVAGAKEADLAWTPDGMLLMAEKDVLYGWRRGETEWRRIADLTALGLHGVSRIAVSPKGDRIAFVATP